MIDSRTSSLRGALGRRLTEIRATPAWAAYERVRRWLLDGGGGSVVPSDYWAEELAALEYLLDASPLVVDRLRHHTYTVTGLRPYDYRAGKDRARERMAAKLEALVELGGEELLVPESPLLGGFGHEIGGALYNVDTLKFYEVLIGMQRGGVLDAFRGGGHRFVWEIGAGWGGFAYQFKTLFPDVTYLIVDLPELFLFSYTYLSAAFPGARVLLHGEADGAAPKRWEDYDFVFVPAGALDEFTPPSVELAVNMVSFQEMTGEQVTAYVERAHGLGTRFLYSLNRERSPYNTQLEGVSQVIGGRFDLEEIPVLGVSYLKMLDGKKRKDKPDPNDYRHLLGRRRAGE